MAQYINKDTYVGDTGKQLKDIKTNADNISNNTTNISNIINTLNDLKRYRNVYEPKYIYNDTGNVGYYELFRIGQTGGWGGRAITFIVQTHNSCLFAMGCIEYYNKSTIQARYIAKTGAVALYYKKNNDNTVSVYAYINYNYSPVWVKMVNHSNIYDNPYPSGVPNAMGSLPSGLTEFGSL